MAKTLVNYLTDRFHGGEKKKHADLLGMSQPAFSKYTKNRPTREWMIAFYWHKYKKVISAEEFLDLVAADYPIAKLKGIRDSYTKD